MLDSVDITTDQTSEPTTVTHLDRASISIEWSGSDSVGEIQFEFRKLKEGLAESQADTDWTAVDFGATINITGASGTHEVIFNALDFTQLRVKYLSTSGTTGILTATLNAKQVGG